MSCIWLYVGLVKCWLCDCWKIFNSFQFGHNSTFLNFSWMSILKCWFFSRLECFLQKKKELGEPRGDDDFEKLAELGAGNGGEWRKYKRRRNGKHLDSKSWRSMMCWVWFAEFCLIEVANVLVFSLTKQPLWLILLKHSVNHTHRFCRFANFLNWS